MTKYLKNSFHNLKKMYKQKCYEASAVHVLPELGNDGREH